MQPGQVIIPHNNSDDPQRPGGAPPEQVPDDAPGAAVPSPSAAPEPTNPAATVTAPPQVLPAPQAPQASVQAAGPAGDSGWQFRQSAEALQSQHAGPSMDESLTWTASEYIAHEKGAGWYLLLAAGGAAAAVADYLLVKDKISTIVIMLAALSFGVLSARKPNVQQYALTYQGLQIGAKAYFFQDFKNFSVAEEGAIASIVFMPMKRFMPPLTIYVAPDMEDRVVDFLSRILPFEQHRADAVDSFMRRIRY